MTYNVFGGTLSLTQSINVYVKQWSRYWRTSASITRTCWSIVASISCCIRTICRTSSWKVCASLHSRTTRAWWPRSWRRRRATIRCRTSPLPTVRLSFVTRCDKYCLWGSWIGSCTDRVSATFELLLCTFIVTRHHPWWGTGLTVKSSPVALCV